MKCVTSVSVTPSSLTIREGQWSNAVKAEVCPEDAECRSVKWYSDNTAVATVNTSSGQIYGKSAGTARVYAAAQDGSGKKDYCTVTVQRVVQVDGIALSTGSLKLRRGNGAQITATVSPSNANNRTLCWQSGDESVATVDGNGWVCAKKAGTTAITASAQDGSGVSATCCVTVTEQVLVQKITICPPGDIYVGDSVLMHAEIEPANAENKCLIWSSGGPNQASINPTSGLLNANMLMLGLKITATAADGSGVSDTIEVDIRHKPVAETLTLSKKEVTMKVGEHVELYPSVCPAETVNKRVNWSTDNEDVVSLEPFGDINGIRVKAEKDGTAVVTAKKVNNDLTASCTVKVDSRERVRIAKEVGDLFAVYFLEQEDTVEVDEHYDSLVWKNLGTLSDAWQADDKDEYYERLAFNQRRTYTVDQLALLYYFDPIGVEIYMKGLQAENDTDAAKVALLQFKDQLYEKIFGEFPRLFSELPSGTIVEYYKSLADTPSGRLSVYSDAEILFGYHMIPYNELAFVGFIGSVLQDLFLTAIDKAIPISSILTGIQLYQALFFSGAIAGAMGNAATSFLNEYLGNADNTLDGKKKMLGWINTALNYLMGVFDSTFYPPYEQEAKIFDKMLDIKTYRIHFYVNRTEYPMEDVEPIRP